ncbi:Uncharacterised domain YOR215C, mitochondrial [Ceraceosorus bombacis]|uniref:Altered inheritance of mitochondria protein 41 n=1 Tax=Ceraceosorus bombacis TaxID=401625 RepID=A0A0P1BFF7_9BASI|nr:Uncharacterised domain YOR215C, mitochondrial [Ceraceosorus bombacis]
MALAIRTSLLFKAKASNAPLRHSAPSLLHHGGVRCLSATSTLRSADAEQELLTRLRSALKDAMRAKDQAKAGVWKEVLSKYETSQKSSTSTTTTTTNLLSILRKAQASRVEAAKDFRSLASPREDLAESESKEAEWIASLLPAELSADELQEAVKKAIQSIGDQGKSTMGKVIKEVSAATQGRADGKQISQAVKKALGL